MRNSRRLPLALLTAVVLLVVFLFSFAIVTAQEAKPSFQLVDVGDPYTITGTKVLTSGVRLLVQNISSATISFSHSNFRTA